MTPSTSMWFPFLNWFVDMAMSRQCTRAALDGPAGGGLKVGARIAPGLAAIGMPEGGAPELEEFAVHEHFPR